ncbi:MAG: AI-2E family transporter [Firmicutes bacterium]|nr:AI-2E family transporter [Bacillota bacterium]
MKLKFEEKYVKWGLTIFFVISACICVFFAFYRYKAVLNAIDFIYGILSPFVVGLVFAYLLCPLYNFLTRSTYSVLKNNIKKDSRAMALSKGVSTFVSLVVFFAVIGGVCWMIIPGLVESLTHIVEIFPASIEQLIAWIDAKIPNNVQMQATLENLVNRFYGNVMEYLEATLLPNYMEVATSISTGVFSILKLLKDFFIGVIVCAYFLNIKDKFAAQAKKLILATFSEEKSEEILVGAQYTNKTFGGFISGKLIDSAIIGVLCFISMTLFGWEYPLLISCIVGITNIIPFFGPFIGAIPSALLILMVNPIQCIYFLIFILALQQLDGNVIGPKILGDTTGIASFWVLFSILVGGGLMGFVGMIIGIPIFAIFYTYFSRSINRRLGKRGFSTDTNDYIIDQYRIKPVKVKHQVEGLRDEIINK